MFAALALLPPLGLFVPPFARAFAQDTQAEPAKRWTQAELEQVSDRIKSDIEALRGMKFKRPVKVQVTDKKGFLEYARKREEKTETPERRDRDEEIAKLLGLIPPEMDLRAAMEKLLESQVGGFYDPGSDTFYLMETFGGDLARIILSHELTHALDDQNFDLDGSLKKLHQETDAEFAHQAIVEGSGMSAMKQWTVQHYKDLDPKALLASEDLGSEGLGDAPQFLWKPLIAGYLCGEGFLVRTAGINRSMKAAETADLRRAFEQPPRSSEQILHPEKYWDAGALDEPRAVTIDASKLPAGWKSAGEDTLGELYLALVTTPVEKRTPLDPKNPLAILGIEYTNEAAEGWGGDRAVLLEKGNARVLWLVTAWDEPEDAEQFREAALAVFGENVDGAKAPQKTSFHYHIDRPKDSDIVVLVAYAGTAEADLPVLTWKVAPRSKPEGTSGEKR